MKKPLTRKQAKKLRKGDKLIVVNTKDSSYASDLEEGMIVTVREVESYGCIGVESPDGKTMAPFVERFALCGQSASKPLYPETSAAAKKELKKLRTRKTRLDKKIEGMEKATDERNEVESAISVLETVIENV